MPVVKCNHHHPQPGFPSGSLLFCCISRIFSETVHVAKNEFMLWWSVMQLKVYNHFILKLPWRWKEHLLIMTMCLRTDLNEGDLILNKRCIWFLFPFSGGSVIIFFLAEFLYDSAPPSRAAVPCSYDWHFLLLQWVMQTMMTGMLTFPNSSTTSLYFMPQIVLAPLISPWPGFLPVTAACETEITQMKLPPSHHWEKLYLQKFFL